ncbi:MAG: Lrp/AsnC family transcriptional regulator, partial [Actinobacteria bacterium]|nr:Lrp/AsnC family transcriptional regulator [Actinomycetota bacterium]
IMRAESASMEDLGRTVLAKVQGVPGITRTLTCPVTTF